MELIVAPGNQCVIRIDQLVEISFLSDSWGQEIFLITDHDRRLCHRDVTLEKNSCIRLVNHSFYDMTIMLSTK